MSKCILCGYDDGGTDDTAHRCKSPLSAHTGMFSQPQVKITTDKMREDFEVWMINKEKIIIGSSDPYPQGLEQTYWRIWQAATAESTAKIELMQARIDELEGVAEDLQSYFQITKDLTREIVEMQTGIDELVEALNEIKSYVDRLPAKHNLNDCEAGSIWAMCINALPTIAKVKDVK